MNKVNVFLKNGRGSTAIEFAFVAPFLLVITFAIVDLFRATLVENAVREVSMIFATEYSNLLEVDRASLDFQAESQRFLSFVAEQDNPWLNIERLEISSKGSDLWYSCTASTLNHSLNGTFLCHSKKRHHSFLILSHYMPRLFIMLFQLSTLFYLTHVSPPWRQR